MPTNWEGSHSAAVAPEARIPCLDGLRAVSIAAVLVSHVAGTPGTEALSRAWMSDLGPLGVRMFFVISGYLITHLLLRESARTGTVSLAAFYRRRAFRILPPLAVYLLTVALLQAAGDTTLSGRVGARDWLAGLTFTMNFHVHPAWTLGHLWSLSVEEQFYLVWPLLVAAGLASACRAALVAVVLAPVARVAWWFLLPHHRALIGLAFPTVADAIAIGCLAALAENSAVGSRLVARLAAHAKWVPVVGVGVVLVSFQAHHALTYFAVGEVFANAGCAFILLALVHGRSSRLQKALQTRPVVALGKLSYSLYLWQQLFVDRHAQHPLTAFPVNLALAFAAALVSYAAVEQPAIRWGRWLGRQVAPQTSREQREQVVAGEASSGGAIAQRGVDERPLLLG